MNVLQRAVAVGFSQLRELNSLGEISFDSANAARQGFTIYVVEKNSKPAESGNLGNAVAHSAGANHGNSFNRRRTDCRAAHAPRTRPAALQMPASHRVRLPH